jgi:Sugar (and other) transporter
LIHSPHLTSPATLVNFLTESNHITSPIPNTPLAVPGYLLSVRYLESVGRKNVQLMGFLVMGLLFVICGTYHDWFLAPDLPNVLLRKILFLLLYSMTFLFSNFGPNTTTFVIPGEIYPAEVRATCHGISAASGKLGAAAGAYFFPLVLGQGRGTSSGEGLKMSMFLCAVVALLGALVTHLFTPRYGAPELLAGEDGYEYLMLEHRFLRPTAGDLDLWESVRLVRSKSSQMLQAQMQMSGTGTTASTGSGSVKFAATATDSLLKSYQSSGYQYQAVSQTDGKTSSSAPVTGVAVHISNSSAHNPLAHSIDVEADVDLDGGLVTEEEERSATSATSKSKNKNKK